MEDKLPNIARLKRSLQQTQDGQRGVLKVQFERLEEIVPISLR